MLRKSSPKNSQSFRSGGTRINEQITGISQVRLVKEDGAEVVSFEEALKMAREQNLDLVEIASGQSIPVCKIIDYGKFKFELHKKTKEAKKKQHVITIKEIKIRPRIDIHDYDIKKKQAIEFLQKGDKVKISLRFKGREMAHTDIGMNIVNKMVEELKDYGNAEKSPMQEGRQIVILINPKS